MSVTLDTHAGVHVHVLPSVARRHPSQWQHGLCGCCDDVGLTCLTMCCPCIVAGRNADAVGYPCCFCGCLSATCFLNVLSNVFIRGKIREQFGIDGGFCGDCMASGCCLCCAYIQQRQEIKTRQPQAGHFDPVWRERASPRRDRRNTDTRRTRLTIIYGMRRKLRVRCQLSCYIFNKRSIAIYLTFVRSMFEIAQSHAMSEQFANSVEPKKCLFMICNKFHLCHDVVKCLWMWLIINDTWLGS